MLGYSLEFHISYLFLHSFFLWIIGALLPALFSHGIYFTPNPNNLPQIQKTILADPSSPSQPGQIPASDPSQQWDSDDEAATQPYGQPDETPQWYDEVTPAVQPYEPPSWDEQDSVSAQSGWASETAAPAEAELAQPDWEDDAVERWGEEGSQVGQEQDADTNWGSGTAMALEAESEPPQWEELQSVRGTRVLINFGIVLGWPKSK